MWNKSYKIQFTLIICHKNPVIHWFDLECNHNKLQTYILKKYSRTFLEILLDYGIDLIF